MVPACPPRRGPCADRTARRVQGAIVRQPRRSTQTSSVHCGRGWPLGQARRLRVRRRGRDHHPRPATGLLFAPRSPTRGPPQEVVLREAYPASRFRTFGLAAPSAAACSSICSMARSADLGGRPVRSRLPGRLGPVGRWSSPGLSGRGARSIPFCRHRHHRPGGRSSVCDRWSVCRRSSASGRGGGVGLVSTVPGRRGRWSRWTGVRCRRHRRRDGRPSALSARSVRDAGARPRCPSSRRGRRRLGSGSPRSAHGELAASAVEALGRRRLRPGPEGRLRCDLRSGSRTSSAVPSPRSAFPGRASRGWRSLPIWTTRAAPTWAFVSMRGDGVLRVSGGHRDGSARPVRCGRVLPVLGGAALLSFGHVVGRLVRGRRPVCEDAPMLRSFRRGPVY